MTNRLMDISSPIITDVGTLWHESCCVYSVSRVMVYMLWHECHWRPASQQPASSQPARQPASSQPAASQPACQQPTSQSASRKFKGLIILGQKDALVFGSIVITHTKNPRPNTRLPKAPSKTNPFPPHTPHNPCPLIG